MSRAAIYNRAAGAARELASALSELAGEGDCFTPAGEVFDSDNLPPRTSRRRFAELCRSGRVAGAYRQGRTWVCLQVAWKAQRKPATPTAPGSGDSASLVERADALLRRTGLRPGSGG